MSILARHRYILTKLAEAFGYADDSEVEQMMLVPETLQAIDFFFTVEGPTKIIICQEEVQVDKKKNSTVKRLRVYGDELDKVIDVAVFFMKTQKNRDNLDNVAIDPSKINDGALQFGVLRGPLESFEAIMRCVYKPILEDMGKDSWGEASADQKSEFMNGIDHFLRGLQESIRSLSGGLDLKKPDERIVNLGAMAIDDPFIINQCMNLLHEWCNNIERYLDDSDRSRWENADSGPDTELNFWKSRTQR